MNEVEHALMDQVAPQLRALATDLAAKGWRPEVIVFDPLEIERMPGYKIGLVIPLTPPESEL